MLISRHFSYFTDESKLRIRVKNYMLVTKNFSYRTSKYGKRSLYVSLVILSYSLIK